MGLKLNGKPLDLNPISPALSKLIAFLDKSPADELWTVDEACAKVRVGESTVRALLSSPALAGYTARPIKVRYYGNPKAIAALLKQVSQ